MGIQINGQTDTISAADGGLNVSGADLGSASAGSLNVTGIVTATSFVGNLTGNINSSGISTVTTLSVTNIKHPSFGGNTFVLDSNGNINIDSGGVYYDATNNRLAIGITSPANALVVSNSGAQGFEVQKNSGTLSGGIELISYNRTTSAYAPVLYDASFHAFGISNSEKARIDSSGRLLVGTSSVTSSYWTGTNGTLQVQATGNYAGVNVIANHASTTGSYLTLGKSRGSSAGSVTIVNSGDSLGGISFEGADGSVYKQAAFIEAFVDGTPGANDMPGRLVFSTTADGESSPTERMRITNGGSVFVGKTSGAGQGNVLGIDLGTSQGQALFVTGSTSILYLNRNTDDGDLIRFAQGGNDEGTISVSGTTVSYNGAHLSRWSQLPGGAKREEILRGTVLSNIDEMCDWGEEDNEQLNRMQVSDVEGDPNVSGVFQCWDDDDDTYTDDFYCAMTGDFIIRIAEGVTVQRGDLLMSAGDGTAKPQGDGFVQDKTIAKVTSNHVTCTYDDGSYCVPCVLMAC
jgi:hypothetical protein